MSSTSCPPAKVRVGLLITRPELYFGARLAEEAMESDEEEVLPDLGEPDVEYSPLRIAFIQERQGREPAEVEIDSGDDSDAGRPLDGWFERLQARHYSRSARKIKSREVDVAVIDELPSNGTSRQDLGSQDEPQATDAAASSPRASGEPHAEAEVAIVEHVDGPENEAMDPAGDEHQPRVMDETTSSRSACDVLCPHADGLSMEQVEVPGKEFKDKRSTSSFELLGFESLPTTDPTGDGDQPQAADEVAMGPRSLSEVQELGAKQVNGLTETNSKKGDSSFQPLSFVGPSTMDSAGDGDFAHFGLSMQSSSSFGLGEQASAFENPHLLVGIDNHPPLDIESQHTDTFNLVTGEGLSSSAASRTTVQLAKQGSLADV